MPDDRTPKKLLHDGPLSVLQESPIKDVPRRQHEIGPGEDVSADQIERLVEYARHYLPAQGPIEVFVHHNTLHAFEEFSFEEGVTTGGRLFGCEPFLSEQRYRQELSDGRIRVSDLESVLIDDLGDEADRLVAIFGTRFALRLAMLQFPLRDIGGAELRWMISESDALSQFRAEVPTELRDRMIDETRRNVMRGIDDGSIGKEDVDDDVFSTVIEGFDRRTIQSWNRPTWQSFTLHFLWRVCSREVRRAAENEAIAGQRDAATDHAIGGVRHRDLLLEAFRRDADDLANEVLIRLCSVFVDQGFAEWSLPHRGGGLFQAFLSLYSESFASPSRFLASLKKETRRLIDAQMDPAASIAESLRLLGVAEDEREGFIVSTLLALRGWAGMISQLETNAEWAPHPAAAGSLLEFLAVRLVVDRIAARQVADASLEHDVPLAQLRQEAACRLRKADPNGYDARAFIVYQIAQARGWNPIDLWRLNHDQWRVLLEEIDRFSPLERRRIFHLAYERKYRNETLDALLVHSRDRAPGTDASRPSFQVACCIDEREESFRRHLEEIDPSCETFGVAGFFGVAIYYRGTNEAHFRPLCPVSVKPQHYMVEQPLYSQTEVERRRAETRRRLGRAAHQAHRGTRSLLGGVLTGLFGSLAAFPLVARILFPRTTSQMRSWFARIVHTEGTELRVERIAADPGQGDDQIGFSVEEMANIVEAGLRAIGLAESELFSRLVVICGHGSSSLNNPHEAAHDCGACGGGRGGPNARAFAQMANDQRVRRLLDARGLVIPSDTAFVGGYHNTCDDSMTWYDLDRLTVPHRQVFERARAEIDEARMRSAHERCRRFESAELEIGIEHALRHVEGRAEDLSQTRPEYGHATNALCFVGRRQWSRGLFLDRRAFLTSYDPGQDDANQTVLEGLLRAVIPVCAGINLEYYFSYVDPTGYGCGTKLPHNITSLVGVMDGASSDLRPGLPWQMVEIHEPVRLLFVIETTPDVMTRIIANNEGIKRLVDGNWVQLAVFDPDQPTIHRYVSGQFVPYAAESRSLPRRDCSTDWYRGRREHLPIASIVAPELGKAMGRGAAR